MNSRKDLPAIASAAQRTPARPAAGMPANKTSVAQAKMPLTQSLANQTRRAPSAPPVYRPQPTPRVLQTKAAVGQQPHPLHAPPQTAAGHVHLQRGVVQLKGGKGKGGKKSAAQQQSKAQRSFNNLCAYRSGWIKRNDITLELVTRFIKECPYPAGIRGHSSGDNSQGEQDNTRDDCLAYKSWHTLNVAAWR
jgi:hypothetical protein